MNIYSFGVSVFLEDEQHLVLTEKKYKYVTTEETEIKILRTQRNEIWAHLEASVSVLRLKSIDQ